MDDCHDGAPPSGHNRQINFPWQFNYALIGYGGNETALKLQASRRSRRFSPEVLPRLLLQLEWPRNLIVECRHVWNFNTRRIIFLLRFVYFHPRTARNKLISDCLFPVARGEGEGYPIYIICLSREDNGTEYLWLFKQYNALWRHLKHGRPHGTSIVHTNAKVPIPHPLSIYTIVQIHSHEYWHTYAHARSRWQTNTYTIVSWSVVPAAVCLALLMHYPLPRNWDGHCRRVDRERERDREKQRRGEEDPREDYE